MLNLYRSHVESLSRLPEFQREQPAPAEEKEVSEQPEEAVSAAEPAVEQPVLTEEEAPEEGEDTPADEQSEAFWAQDESQLKLEIPPEARPDYAAFQGVQFSD